MSPRAALTALLLAASAATAAPATVTVAPYKDVSHGMSPAEVPGRLLVWAFATGECGDERWGDADADGIASAQVAAFVRAGKGYIVSTGGALGAFTCGSDAGMARFVARYDSPRLVGLDFDIEGSQTPAQIDSLVQRLAVLARLRPALRLSFTLATHAASDGSRQSLNATGEQVLAALRRHGLPRAVLNLMVMNYGDPRPRHCVLRTADDGQPACDMGRSALQAARNVHARYRVPYHRIALTAMPGENDVARNVFTLADARVLRQGARALGIEALHYWSLDRDQPCPDGEPRVSPRCHALPGVEAGAFARAFGAPRP